jgi:ethanolamine utilization protein EutJ
MAITWQELQQRLDKAARILNDPKPVKASGPFKVGIDLGTADVVLMVLDKHDEPAACFLEWSQVVRDGVVVDFIGAVDIVRGLLEKAQPAPGDRDHQGLHLLSARHRPAALHQHPGAGYWMWPDVEDEPTCVANLLRLDRAAVVDVGGGTTGTAVVQNGSVVFSGDEPTGGTHISLVIAGHYQVDFEEAERVKAPRKTTGFWSWPGPPCKRFPTLWPATLRAIRWTA